MLGKNNRSAEPVEARDLARRLIDGMATATRISTGTSVQITSISVLWLVYGKDASYPKTQKVTDLKTREPDTIDRAAAIMATMSRDGQLVAIGRLMELAQQYPRAKPNQFQLLIFPELGAAARLRHNSSHDN